MGKKVVSVIEWKDPVKPVSTDAFMEMLRDPRSVEAACRILKTLTPLEQKVLKMRFGRGR